jgi:hypothetical protein
MAVYWDEIVTCPQQSWGRPGQMVKSVSTIYNFFAMLFNMVQLHIICTSLKLTGYRNCFTLLVQVRYTILCMSFLRRMIAT